MIRTFLLVWSICWLLVALTGCGTEARSPDPKPDPLVETLGDIGSTLAWVGGISAAAGVGLSLVAFAFPALAPFAAIFRLAAVGGVGVTGTGAATIWLSDNLWLLALGIAASVGAVVWWYWPSISGAWRRRLAGQADRQEVG